MAGVFLGGPSLNHLGNPGHDVEGLLRTLASRESRLRNFAVTELAAGIRSGDPRANRILRQLLEVVIKDSGLDDVVAQALTAHRSEVASLVSDLLIELRSSAGLVRRDAVRLLDRCILILGVGTPEAVAVVSGLLAALGDPDKGVREEACFALGAFAGTTPSLAPALLSSLSDGVPEVVRAAAFSLSRVDEPSVDILLGLSHLCSSGVTIVRRAGIRAIDRISSSRPSLLVKLGGACFGGVPTSPGVVPAIDADAGRGARGLRESLVTCARSGDVPCIVAALNVMERLPVLEGRELEAVEALCEHPSPKVRLLALVLSERRSRT